MNSSNLINLINTKKENLECFIFAENLIEALVKFPV